MMVEGTIATNGTDLAIWDGENLLLVGSLLELEGLQPGDAVRIIVDRLS